MWSHIDCCSPSAAFAATLSLDALAWNDDPENDHAVLQIDSGDTTPLELIDQRAAERAVHVFLATLSPREREIARQHFWDGLSQADIARALGVTRMAVCKVINKVLARGRTTLAPFQNHIAA